LSCATPGAFGREFERKAAAGAALPRRALAPADLLGSLTVAGGTGALATAEREARAVVAGRGRPKPDGGAAHGRQRRDGPDVRVARGTSCVPNLALRPTGTYNIGRKLGVGAYCTRTGEERGRTGHHFTPGSSETTGRGAAYPGGLAARAGRDRRRDRASRTAASAASAGPETPHRPDARRLSAAWGPWAKNSLIISRMVWTGWRAVALQKSRSV
jgi:hypothetical protein